MSSSSSNMEYSKLKGPSQYLLFAAILLLQLIASSLVAGERQVPCFFVFGDSLVDNGNNNYRKTTSKVDFLPYGIDFPGGPTGRFTNGRNIADVVAELLGFEKLIPPYANATAAEIRRRGGVNYASGGSGILDGTGRAVFGDVISMNEQISNHEAAISLAGLSKRHLRKCIYYIATGNNDYLVEFFPDFYSNNGTHRYTPKKYASLLIRRHAKQLQRLYDDGARKFALAGLGRLGCVPVHVAMYGSQERDSASCIKKTNEIAEIFDAKLKTLARDLNRRLPDAKFLHIGGTVSSFGKITNLKDPCCATAVGDGTTKCMHETIPCGDRDDYVFWDEVHPSEAANIIFGKSTYDQMTTLLGDENEDSSFVDDQRRVI